MIRKLVSVILLLAAPALAAAPDPAHFKVEVLASGFTDPQEMARLPDGRILICERTGGLKLWAPGSDQLADVGALEVAVRDGDYARECGFLGLTADPEFADNHWLYAYYSAPDESLHRLSRFTFRDDQLALDSEKILLEVPTERQNNTCHEGGSLAFGPDGLLYLSTGDNTNPFSEPASPIEEHRKELDAQRSASNSNDLRGKILRLDVRADGTYRIPPENLFPPGTPKTRPEIYAMGLRNPYRITLNSKTGTLFWSDVAPDKTPTGEEINRAKTAGYYGWPYVITDNKPFSSLEGIPFDPSNLRNTSRHNTGITELPEPREPIHFYDRSCSIMGGIYHATDAPGAFPAYYDNCLLFADWNHSWFQFVRLDQDENKVEVEDFNLNFTFRKPIDMFFHDGVLHVLEYGNGWYDVTDGRLLRVSYSPTFDQQADPSDDPRLTGMDLDHPGTELMRTATCLSCHHAKETLIGPSFVDIAAKYGSDPAAKTLLAARVREGSVGVWGNQPMPAHAMHSAEELKVMIEAILAPQVAKD